MGLSYPIKQTKRRKANIICLVPFVNLRIYGAIYNSTYAYIKVGGRHGKGKRLTERGGGGR